ncbi:hypothetical protein ACHAWF_018025 [Thalassiosira exigua]
MDDSERAQFAAELGASVNKNGGIYARGVSYGYAKKLEVAAEIKFVEALASREGKDPSLNAIAKRCRVGWHFVKKIQDELYFYGRVRRPSEILENKDILRGAGARTLDSLDRFVLLQLLREQPGRSLTSYHKLLFDYTGTVASKKTISRFFREAFPHRGGFVKPNLVPYDKFRPENKTRAYEFLYMLSHFAPERVKFGDEKSLKGQELYSKKVRRDPETGDVPVVATPSDFRNTYSITGFCSIDQRTNPIFYRIHKDNNNSLEFRNDIEDALREGFLVAGDVLVLDNVAYHTGKCNKTLADWLWESYGIFVLLLPPRCPEWNPIELAWNTLVQRLGADSYEEMEEKYGTTDTSAKAAKEELDRMDHALIWKFYMKCFKGELID